MHREDVVRYNFDNDKRTDRNTLPLRIDMFKGDKDQGLILVIGFPIELLSDHARNHARNETTWLVGTCVEDTYVIYISEMSNPQTSGRSLASTRKPQIKS